MRTSLNIELEPSSKPSTNMQWKKIRLSHLNTSHRQFIYTPEEKFQDQWMLIRFMQTNMSTINDAKIITKTQIAILDY